MGRIEYLPCLYRGPDGRILQSPYPQGEPDPYDVPADLYCPSYEILTSLFGPPKLGHVEVTIFNARGYRPDPELAEAAKQSLVHTIEQRGGAAVVQAAGGQEGVKARIGVDTFWFEPSDPRSKAR